MGGGTFNGCPAVRDGGSCAVPFHRQKQQFREVHVMKIQVSAQVLLIVATVLLAANLVLMFAVYGTTPAHAEDPTYRTCVGIAVASDPDTGYQTVYKAWNDGRVDKRTYY